MTAAVFAGPSVLAGMCLIIFATPWLERLTDLRVGHTAGETSPAAVGGELGP